MTPEQRDELRIARDLLMEHGFEFAAARVMRKVVIEAPHGMFRDEADMKRFVAGVDEWLDDPLQTVCVLREGMQVREL